MSRDFIERQPLVSPPDLPASAQLMQMIFGYMTTQTIALVAKLGIADMLSDGAKSVDEMAIATGMQLRPLYRILRALASVGIFAEEDGRRFRLTPLAEPLRSDTTDSLRHFAILSGTGLHWNVWSDLPYTAETGKPNFERIHGKSYFEHLAENPWRAT